MKIIKLSRNHIDVNLKEKQKTLKVIEQEREVIKELKTFNKKSRKERLAIKEQRKAEIREKILERLKGEEKLKCRKCGNEKHCSHFPYLLIPELTYYKQETCKLCWQRQPYSKKILRQAKSAKKHFTKQRAHNLTLSAKRRSLELQACPKWADQKAISRIYTMAKNMEIESGVTMHVDHILPLNNKLICGLHVEFNLTPITGRENLCKSNKFIPFVEYPDGRKELIVIRKTKG